MNKIAPYFIVDNVLETVDFYTNTLGFSIDFLGETPFFTILSRDKITIMFRQLKEIGHSNPNHIAHLTSGWHTSNGAEAWDAYIWVDNADVLFKEFVSKDVSIIKEIQNTDYGNRDFEIQDNNGYILCFGQVLK